MAAHRNEGRLRKRCREIHILAMTGGSPPIQLGYVLLLFLCIRRATVKLGSRSQKPGL